MFSPGDGASGLIGSGDSNGSVSVGGGAGGWVPDGTGGYYNPGTGCYTNRSQIVCNWQGYEETFGDGSSELDMLSLGGSRASWKEVFGALDRASARLAALAGGLMWMPDAVVDCADDLTAMGIDGSMVAKGALDAVFNNGVGSAVLASTLYASAPNPTLARLAPTVTGTIGDIFARNAGTVAVSQLGGNNIYFNPAMMDPGNVMGTLFHEVVHNVSGLTDSDIQRALNLPESPATKNITDKLMKDCF